MQLEGPALQQLCPGARRGIQKSSFPVLYVGPEGCDGDSESQVPSATLHVSITLCCPFTCLPGLANVNKIVTPFPIWAHVGHPTPCAPRGRDCRERTDKTQDWSLRKQCQCTPDSWNRIRDSGNRALEQSWTHWADFALIMHHLMARHNKTQRFGAASLLGSSSLTLSRFCTAGVVSTAALEHLKWCTGGNAQRSHQSGISPGRVPLSPVLQRQEGTNPDCSGCFPVCRMLGLLRRRLLTWSTSKDMSMVLLASWFPRRERGQATLGL